MYLRRQTLDVVGQHHGTGVGGSVSLTFSPNDVCVALANDRAELLILDCTPSMAIEGVALSQCTLSFLYCIPY